MERVAIIGAGDLGQQIAHYMRTDGVNSVVGYFDDTYTKGDEVMGTPILGTIKEIPTLFKEKAFDALLVGIGYKHLEFKKYIFETYKNIPFATYVHSSVLLDPTAHIAAGAVVFPGCILDKNVSIEKNTLLNIGCSISHDSVIGAHSFLSPRVAVAGFTKIIGESMLGINCTIIDNLVLTKGCRIGAGAVVTSNCNEKGLYVGVPAKFKKTI